MGASFFPPGSGGQSEWLSNVNRYVDPSGNDSNDGKSWQSPKKTIYAGILNTVLAGGGTLYVADGCTVGGPVSGQGIWLRGDDFAAPGFIGCPPLRIVGAGKVNGGSFMPDVSSSFTGGGTRTKPSIWIVNSSNNSITIENMKCDRLLQAVRIGNDFDRKPDGTIQSLTVTNATRTSTSTVLTVTLPATGIACATASRTSNVVTMVLTNPGIPWPPLRTGTPFTLTSSNVNFASGDYVVTSITGARGGLYQATWTITYAETAANVGSQAVTGNVKTHGCQANEIIEFQSTNSHFVASQYVVTAATATTVTVLDYVTDGNQNVNNPGTMVRVEFHHAGTSSVNLRKISAPLFQATSGVGPGIILGHNYALPPYLESCYAEGVIYEANPTQRDEYRMCAVLAYPGNPDHPVDDITATGFRIENPTGIYGGIFGIGGAGIGDFIMRYGTIESPITAGAEAALYPALRVNGGPSTKVLAENIQHADAPQAAFSVVLTDVTPSAAFVRNCGPGRVSGACIGGDNFWVPNIWGPGNNEPTPWERQQVTPWAGGRISGKHPGTARANAPVTARFKNIVLTPGSWSVHGATRTLNSTDVAAPDGSHTATKIVTVNDYIDIFPSAVDGNTWHVGGRLFVGGWYWATDDLGLGSGEFFSFASSGASVSQTNSAIPADYCGTGWQYVSGVFNVSAVSDPTPDFTIRQLFPTGKTIYMWGQTAYYIDTDVDDNDAFEHAGVARQQPKYLVPPNAGTMESQKLYGHGGFGTDSANAKTVGVGSGQLTLTGTDTVYLPMYDLDGSTIIGWVAQLQATVNP